MKQPLINVEDSGMFVKFQWVSVQGGVSVQGVSVQHGLCLGGLSRGSLSGRPSQPETPLQ